MKEPRYIITAINRLTGEREAISSPRSEWKAREMLEKMLCTPRKTKFRSRDYKYPRMERYQPEEGVLPFAPPPLKSGLPECSDRKSVREERVLFHSGRT